MSNRQDIQRSDYLYRKPPYLYFRFPARFKMKPVGLPADETSAAFRRSYDACMATLQKLEVAEAPPLFAEQRQRRRDEPGTIARAVTIFLGSAAFAEYKGDTPRIYRSILDKMRERIGDGQLCDLDRAAMEDYHDKVYDDTGAKSTADLHLVLMSNVWTAVRKMEQFGIRNLPNPTREIERKHKPSESQPHLRWNEDAQDRFMDTARGHLRLAKEVLHFSLQRGGDCVRMQWDHYDGRGLKVWPQKTTKKGAVLEPKYHRLPKKLIRILDTAKKDAESEYILVTSRGKPWANARTLADALRRHLIKIGLAKRGKKTISMHGLRHTGGSDVAMLPGVGVKGIQSAIGHKTARMSLRYSEQVEAARLQARVIDAWDAEIEEQERERAARAPKKRAALRVVK
jgi:integrase